jgi:sec-independent protein translocase protein TatC
VIIERGQVDDPEIPVVEHLVELRLRLIYSLLTLAAGTALCYPFSAPLLSWLARPAGGLVFTAPTEAFMVRLKVAGAAGLLVSLPFVLNQAWLFVAPAMERRWKGVIRKVIPLSYVLFIGGAALAILVVVPAAMRFLLSYGTAEIKPLLTLSNYLEFVTQLAVSFGLVFQLPLVLFAANRAGLVAKDSLGAKRRYIYLGSFVAAAFLTPGPDIFSQLALALPAVVLFELTLLAL